MGCYVNPPDMSKEEFLKKNGSPLSKQEFLDANFDTLNAEGKMVVILVDNGPFTAAAIANSDRELKYWQDEKSSGRDYRPATYYTCPIDLLKPYL
jgi:hypothetical protein